MRYIFNTSGDYVAFIVGGYLFSPQCEWTGFIQNGNEVYNSNGEFIGYVSADDRIVFNRLEARRARLLRPMRPMRPLRPLRPLRRLRMPRLPHPWVDIFDQ